MKLKKILSLLLATCLMLSLLSACGGSGDKETEEESTEDTMEIMQKTDPAQDDTLNILMIGNSFCYYYPDELYGLAEAAGMKIRVCNVYASGCKMEEHWDWWKQGKALYEIYATYDDNGRQTEQWWTLEQCLQQQNWDIITLQESSSSTFNRTPQQAFDNCYIYCRDLLEYLRTQFPQSKFYWHQVWSYQVGYNRENYPNFVLADQREQATRMQGLAALICKEFDLGRINTGDAWQIVRDGGYDNLCARTAINNGEGDYYHDGDIGGGQYLNACVWFEVLTGQSCVGNTWRPTEYALDEDLVQTLQQAAHQAVANLTASAN